MSCDFIAATCILRVCTTFSVFFFSSRRRHTRSDRDWSSDVCSSDLDMPHNTYRNAKEALKNAKKIMSETKSDAVKLEGDRKSVV